MMRLPLWTLILPACGICRWTSARRRGSEPAMGEEQQGDLFSCITVDDVRASRHLCCVHVTVNRLQTRFNILSCD